MSTSLPERPSLENLKKRSKTLLKAWQAGEPAAIARIRSSHPQHATQSPAELEAVPRLADCHLVLARELGFDTWSQLKVAVQAAHLSRADEFVETGCLCYDDPHYDHRSFHARANAMLREDPGLGAAHIWSAATAGNIGAVRAFLDHDPQLVSRPGPHGWAPLICACYSRVEPLDSTYSTLQVASLLLDRGADPNAFTMKGNADERLSQSPRRFTALAGIVGGGSTGLVNQPPHSQWRELAELLLARGANAADERALSLNQDACLEILLNHGLKPDDLGSDGLSLMGRALSQAARNGHADQVRLLLDHGARTDEKFNGKLPWDHAVRLGRVEIAQMLQQAGAPVAELDLDGRFISLCMAGDERSARAMLAGDPDLLIRAPKDMVHRAVWTRRISAVQLVLDLGFDPNYQEDNPAITHVGALAENEAMLRLLLDRGASLKLRDPWYDGTAIGWAEFTGLIDLRDRLLNEPGISLFDALDFDRLDRVADILKADPSELDRPFAECVSREPTPDDWPTPLARMVLRGKLEAVVALLQHGADPTIRHPDGRSLGQIARDQGFHEIAGLLAGIP